jgi:hypothetical protein
MVTNAEGYNDLILFLTEHLAIFGEQGPAVTELTIADYVTERVAESVMAVCQQHPQLDSDHRFSIIRESDSVVNDLEEVLSSVWHHQPTQEQCSFIDDFVGLIKNLFDSAIISIDSTQ